MRWTHAMAAIVTAGLLVVGDAVARPPAAPPAPRTTADGEVSVRTLLNRRTPLAQFDGVPLADVVDFLRDTLDMNVFVNWPALEAAGVGQDVAVTLRLRQLPVRKVLDLALQQAGQGQLTWYVADNVVHVTTKELADRQLVTRLYPVQDLIVEVPDFRGPTFNLSTGGSGGGNNGGGGSGGGSLIGGGNGGNDEDDRGATRAERGQKLVDLVMMLVEPDVWQDNGGPANIRFFNGYLIVTAPRSVHDKLAKPVD